jgi:hypothetical protein
MVGQPRIQISADHKGRHYIGMAMSLFVEG